jgi:hypothetical protein
MILEKVIAQEDMVIIPSSFLAMPFWIRVTANGAEFA